MVALVGGAQRPVRIGGAMPLSVYIWFQGPHLKLLLNPTDEVLFFDGASNLVAKISGEILLRQLAHAMNALALETMMRDEVAPKPLAALPPRRLTTDMSDTPATPNEKERAELRKLRRSRRRGLKVLAALAGCVLLALFNEAGWADSTLTELLWEEMEWFEVCTS